MCEWHCHCKQPYTFYQFERNLQTYQDSAFAFSGQTSTLELPVQKPQRAKDYTKLQRSLQASMDEIQVPDMVNDFFTFLIIACVYN